MTNDTPARRRARELRAKASNLSTQINTLAGIEGAEDLAKKKAAEAQRLREEIRKLEDQARLEDMTVYPAAYTKTNKKTGERREYLRWRCNWREGGKLREVYLGSCSKMTKEEAEAKARRL
jgi:hypothetical protein